MKYTALVNEVNRTESSYCKDNYPTHSSQSLILSHMYTSSAPSFAVLNWQQGYSITMLSIYLRLKVAYRWQYSCMFSCHSKQNLSQAWIWKCSILYFMGIHDSLWCAYTYPTSHEVDYTPLIKECRPLEQIMQWSTFLFCYQLKIHLVFWCHNFYWQHTI